MTAGMLSGTYQTIFMCSREQWRRSLGQSATGPHPSYLARHVLSETNRINPLLARAAMLLSCCTSAQGLYRAREQHRPPLTRCVSSSSLGRTHSRVCSCHSKVPMPEPHSPPGWQLKARGTQQMPGRLCCLAANALPVLALAREAFWVACSGTPLPAGTQPSAGRYCIPLLLCNLPSHVLSPMPTVSLTCCTSLETPLRHICGRRRPNHCCLHSGGFAPLSPNACTAAPCAVSRCTQGATVRRPPGCLQKGCPCCKEAGPPAERLPPYPVLLCTVLKHPKRRRHALDVEEAYTSLHGPGCMHCRVCGRLERRREESWSLGMLWVCQEPGLYLSNALRLGLGAALALCQGRPFILLFLLLIILHTALRESRLCLYSRCRLCAHGTVKHPLAISQ